MNDEPMYDDWIAKRQSVEPSRQLADRVMAAIEEQRAQHSFQVRLADRMNHSLPARCAACLASLLVGSLPLLYVAHAAKLLVF